MRWRSLAACGLAALPSVAVAQDPCAQLSVPGIRPGASVADVRATVRMEPSLSHQVVLAGGTRVTVEDYNLRQGVGHVQYDGLANRGATRVTAVWQPLRLTADAVSSLV